MARICNAYHLNIISIRLVRNELHLLRLNEIENMLVLVDVAIVYHNDQIWAENSCI